MIEFFSLLASRRCNTGKALVSLLRFIIESGVEHQRLFHLDGKVDQVSWNRQNGDEDSFTSDVRIKCDPKVTPQHSNSYKFNELLCCDWRERQSSSNHVKYLKFHWTFVKFSLCARLAFASTGVFPFSHSVVSSLKVPKSNEKSILIFQFFSPSTER